MRMKILFGIVMGLLLMTSAVAQAVVNIEPVVTGKGEQYRGFANDSYVVYTQWNRRTRVSTAFAKSSADGLRTKMNADGTYGNTGGIDPGFSRVLYQQWTGRRSGLFFYDLDTGARTRVAGVNSRFWEWNPLISSTFIVFALDKYRKGDAYTSLKVFNRTTNITRTLGTWKWGPNRMFPGSAGDRYVTYTFCKRAANCFAFVYDWDTNTRQRIPRDEGDSNWAPVVDEMNGTVYYTRTDGGCGVNAEILRRPMPIDIDDVPTAIVDFPNGIDTGWESSLSLNGTTGGMDLYIERYDCARRTGDVYVARGVDAEGTP